MAGKIETSPLFVLLDGSLEERKKRIERNPMRDLCKSNNNNNHNKNAMTEREKKMSEKESISALLIKL